jgi:hypothetical protein
LVGGKNLLHGLSLTDHGDGSRVQMKKQTHHKTFPILHRSKEEFITYVNLLTKAVQWIHKNHNEPEHYTDVPVGDIIIISFLISEFDWYCTALINSLRSAAKVYRNPDTYWKTIALGVWTPDVEKAWLYLHPDLPRPEYFPPAEIPLTPQKIISKEIPTLKKKHFQKRGQPWKLDVRWDHLWNSSRAVFLEILRRTQYPKRPGNFPWCQAGIRSLAKFTHFSPRQIQDALIQLERFKLIKRILKGNNFQGCSKYLIFITPKMSGAFSLKSLHVKKDPHRKKRITRMR